MCNFYTKRTGQKGRCFVRSSGLTWLPLAAGLALVFTSEWIYKLNTVTRSPLFDNSVILTTKFHFHYEACRSGSTWGPHTLHPSHHHSYPNWGETPLQGPRSDLWILLKCDPVHDFLSPPYKGREWHRALSEHAIGPKYMPVMKKQVAVSQFSLFTMTQYWQCWDQYSWIQDQDAKTILTH